jgi:hypothetical protein
MRLNRFAALAVVCAGLTIACGYVTALSAIDGIEALIGIGTPRDRSTGLIGLGLAALLLNLTWLTLRAAHRFFGLMRLTAGRRRDRTA